MIDEVLKDLFRIEIPLPGSPLGTLNAYVIKTPNRNLMIDTGMNREECLEAMQAALKDLQIDLRKTDFFITHMHLDHSGLLPDLTTDTSKVFYSRWDAERIRSGTLWEGFAVFARMNGFPEGELKEVLLIHPGHKFHEKRLEQPSNFIMVEGDSPIDIGDYHFRTVHTPGHTEGHMCLYEQDRKVFVSGDHILYDITPMIQLWSDDENPLADYLSSLSRVEVLDIDLVLPGHRKIFRDWRKRIQELKLHHEQRAEEVLNVLRKDSKNAFQVASEMSWDIESESWEVLPVLQKWFAMGEAMAHLKYLEREGKIKKEVRGATVEFSPLKLCH
jgi:glyoxylase-like metal-dependent hydrolase (beta-lactamase superfamily II)